MPIIDRLEFNKAGASEYNLAKICLDVKEKMGMLIIEFSIY